MGTGLGPAWFTPDFPAVAARREPFPDVERWQTSYVRYSLSDAAQVKGWDAETCRRNLSNLGLNEHPLLRHASMPDSMTMRIVEAPAEFALPVKQDRRLLPCFKIRLEVQHRGPVSLPVTLRAHVLSQQDKEQITSWMPLEESSCREDKGQKAATELKGTSFIRCTLEAGDTGELWSANGGAKEGQGLPQTSSGAGPSPGLLGLPQSGSGAMRGNDRLIKAEPSFGFNAAVGGLGPGPAGSLGLGLGPAAGNPGAGNAGMVGVAPGGSAGFGLSGPHQRSGVGVGSSNSAVHQEAQPHVLDAYGGVDPSGLNGNGILRDVGGTAGLLRDLAAPPGPPRDVGFGNLFAPNRPDPVVTLASSGRMSHTGSNLSGLGSGLGGNGASSGIAQPGLLGPGLRMGNPGETRDAFDAAVEMLMQPSSQQQSQQQQQQRRGPSPLHGMLDPSLGGPKLLNDMQRQLQQQQQEEQNQRLQQGGPHTSKLLTAIQDFEFTNLEFLKPTRMNKVYMAFTASIFDTDHLFVVFNVPTIGICRAEQREKACKKLHIDYRLLSHFDQGAERSAPALPASPATHASGAATPQDAASTGPPAGSMSVARLGPKASAPQALPDTKFTQAAGPNLNPMMGIKFGQMAESKLQMADTDYPRTLSGMSIQGRPGDCGMAGGGMSAGPAGGVLGGAGGGFPGPGLAAGGGMMGAGLGAGGLVGTGLGAAGMAGGGAAGGVAGGLAGGLGGGCLGGVGLPGGGLVGSGMPHGGMGGGGLGGRMLGGGITYGLPNGMAGDLGNPSAEFFFASGGVQNNSMGMALNGMGSGAGLGGSGHPGPELGILGVGSSSRKRDQGLKEDDNYRFQPVPPSEMPPYQGFMGLTSSDVDMLLPAPQSRMAMRDFINEVYDGTGLHRKLTHMDMQALLSQAGFPMDSNREHDTISPQQWDEFCSQFRNIVNTLQQVASVWNMEDPVVISGFDMDRAGTITALANEPAGTFICRFSMSQPGCLVLTCKVGTVHPRADNMGLIHAIIKIDDLNERRVDTWIRDYAGATHLLDVYRQKRVDKRKVFATNYTRLRGLEVGEQPPMGLGQSFS